MAERNTGFAKSWAGKAAVRSFTGLGEVLSPIPTEMSRHAFARPESRLDRFCGAKERRPSHS